MNAVTPILDRRVSMMRHALGLNNSESGQSYRNRYLVPENTGDHEIWQRMEKQHLAFEIPMVKQDYPFIHYRLTLEGAESALRRGERLDPEDFPAMRRR